MTNQTVRVGDEVVVGMRLPGGFTPIVHNHGSARGTVRKIGPKWTHVSSNGGDLPILTDPDAYRGRGIPYRILPVAEARVEYRRLLEGPGHRDAAFIDECVAAL